MNQTPLANRIVLIGSTASAVKKTGYRRTKQRSGFRRIVVIRNGEFVGQATKIMASRSVSSSTDPLVAPSPALA